MSRGLDDEQHALYERIVETTSEGVWVIDAGSVTSFVNRSMADMLGYAREEIVGRSLFDLMDDEGKRIAASNVERRKSGITEEHEFVFRRKDGRPLWVRMVTNPLVGPEGEYGGALALVSDLTDARGRDAERERLWRIIDESRNEIFLFRESDLRFEYVNRGGLMNLRHTLGRMREMTPVDIQPERTRESFREMVSPLVDGRVAKLVFRTRHRRADDTTYPVEVHLQLVPGEQRLFLAIVSDISDRVEAERALRANEVRFRALIEQSADLIMLADADGLLTFVSPSVTTTLGYEARELLGRDLLSTALPDDRATAAGAVERARSSADSVSFEYRVAHRAGGHRTLAVSVRSLLEHPEVRAIVLNARDATNERALEEQLQQSQRLESIGRLAGGVAHDFNNILTTILGAAGFLSEAPGLGESARADVQEILNAGKRASELTNQLLAFARRRVVRPQAVRIGAMLGSQERFLRRVLGEQITLNTVVPEGTWPVFVDPAQLEQVIVNLAVNARDAMAKGGRLTLEASNATVDESFASTHPGVKPGSYVLLVVSDTGEGIPADVLPHVFEPFFTTKPVGGGSGLGLATVYGIVRQSNGHIWVYSEPGVGTTFKVYLPRAPEPGPDAATPVSPNVRGGSERVLVVEDDPAVRQMVLRALESAGYSVHVEPSPEAGLAWARAQGGRFELLVTDVVMPGMSGKELATQLTGDFPNVRVLYVSGYTENTIVHRGVLEEGVEFLGKPFSPSDLRARVRQVLDRT